MNGADLPDDLPESMVKPLSALGLRGEMLRDNEHQSPWQEESRLRMKKCLEYLETKIFPKIK